MEQLQINAEYQHPGWTDSSLPAFAEELDRNSIFRGLISESEVNGETRSVADNALAFLLPTLRPAISAWYGDTGSLLKDLIDNDALQRFDEWLATEVEVWARHWNELDPARRGGTGSTRDALTLVRRELGARQLPPSIVSLVATCGGHLNEGRGQ